MNFDTIVIRKEFKQNEYRTPLVPTDVSILVSNNFNVFIENFSNRCFLLEEYIANGAKEINQAEIYELNKDHTLIIGLKDLDIKDIIYFKFNHLYFSHTYKNQIDSYQILNMFKCNGGKIYDLEYLTDTNNNRLVYFGNHAGFIGAILGICQYIYRNDKKTLTNLKPILDINNELLNLKNMLTLQLNKPNIAIIGPNGKCGKGAIDLLNLFELQYSKFERTDSKLNLSNYNIIINCIFLNKNDEISPFIDNNSMSNFKNCVIVDVSCDYSNKNNPIRIYDKLTSHENPVAHINSEIDLIVEESKQSAAEAYADYLSDR